MEDRHTPEKPKAFGVCEQLRTFWNENCGSLPKVSKLNKERRAKILARIKADADFPETFRAAVLKASKTPFLCGQSARGWSANFDWFIRNEGNAVKVLEGNYESAIGAKRSASAKPIGTPPLTPEGLKAYEAAGIALPVGGKS